MELVAKKEPILDRVILEIRYNNGYTFLDVCGRILNKIMKEEPEWVLRGLASPQGAGILSLKNAAMMTFSSDKIDFSMERPVGGDAFMETDIMQFANQVHSLAALVIEQLGVSDFTRIGCRVNYLFAAESENDAQSWLTELKLFSVSPAIINAFNGTIDSSNNVVMIRGQDRRFRIEFAVVERQAQIDFGQGVLAVKPHHLKSGQDKKHLEDLILKRRMRQNPSFASIIDIDAFQDDPTELSPKDFLITTVQSALKSIVNAVKEAQK